jgi:hypothetical protein
MRLQDAEVRDQDAGRSLVIDAAGRPAGGGQGPQARSDISQPSTHQAHDPPGECVPPSASSADMIRSRAASLPPPARFHTRAPAICTGTSRGSPANSPSRPATRKVS